MWEEWVMVVWEMAAKEMAAWEMVAKEMVAWGWEKIHILPSTDRFDKLLGNNIQHLLYRNSTEL